MKRLLALLLCLGLLAVPARAAVPGWAEDAYAALDARGLLTQDRREASGDISRGDFAALLVDAVQAVLPAEELAAYPPKDPSFFDDAVEGDALLYAAAYGILEGARVGDQRLAQADTPLNREQAAKMVCSALDFFASLGYEVTAPGAPAVYADAASISPWAAPFTGRVAAYSIMVGDQAGRFNPAGRLDWPSAVVALSRTLERMDLAASGLEVLELDSALDWSGALGFGAGDYAVSRPLTGFAKGYYTVDNGDGTVSGVQVKEGVLTAEVYDSQGAVTATRTLPAELPILGTVFGGKTYNYAAFGQSNNGSQDGQETWRIVQYDKDWNRLGAVSLTAGETYTTEPFRSAVPRMAESADGSTVALYAARTRYDGHQSNITFILNAQPFSLRTCMGEQFPSNHVSHSFGQFVQYDGSAMVTVDHGDAYPRSFVLQAGGQEETLLEIFGDVGDNVTHAIGSGFEVSDSGYLFLGCSDPQQGGEDQPWNVFLTCTDKNLGSTRLTWLTDNEETISCARLVKLGGDAFAALWAEGDGLHVQLLDGRGNLTGSEKVLSGVPMPPTQPVVQDGAVRWIQADGAGAPCLYTLDMSGI